MTSGRSTDDAPGLAPVIPLFGSRDRRGVDAAAAEPPPAEPGWHASWTDDALIHAGARAWGAPASDMAGRGDSGYGDAGRPAGCGDTGGRAAGHGDAEHDDAEDDCTAIEREIAEQNLLKRLRGRQLSVAEARAVVRERSLDAATADAVIARFCDLGYLDDAALADQLVRVGTERKEQGRRVVAQTLAARGIPRDVAEAAVGALPDDDADRALEYARAKVRAMARLDRDTAVRRLVGQLSRRGYAGAVAATAARAAWEEIAPAR